MLEIQGSTDIATKQQQIASLAKRLHSEDGSELEPSLFGVFGLERCAL